MVVQLELSDLMQQNSISQLRNNDAYVKCCEAHTVGLGKIQAAVDYLGKCLDVEQAEGVWLDNIGLLVGTNRGAFNMLDFFCLNAPHLNTQKYFYFEGESNYAKGNINDVLFRQKIKSKIAYNSSKCTREDNLKVIKGLTNADKVIITVEKTMILNVTLIGDEIIYPSEGTLREFISYCLGTGVGLNKLEILGKAEAEQFKML